MLKICCVLLVVSLCIVPAVAAPVQWTVASGGNGHWYEVVVVDDGILWNDAKTAAENAGGYLAVVTSSDENDFIYSIADPIADAWDSSGINTLGPWLGGYQDPGNNDAWTWVTGEPFSSYANSSYANWGSSQPNDNGDYLNIYGLGGSHGKAWNDYSDVVPSYVVESVPEPATMSLLAIGGLMLIRRRK